MTDEIDGPLFKIIMDALSEKGYWCQLSYMTEINSNTKEKKILIYVKPKKETHGM
jgi:hypothetical protein